MSDQSVLITGSSTGIGRAIAYAFAEAGYNVGVHGLHHPDRGLEVVENIQRMGRKAIYLSGDISDPEQLKTVFDDFFKYFGHINALINNAGISKYRLTLDATPDYFDLLFNTNFKAHYFATQMGARRMIEDGIKGCIVNITSVQEYVQLPESGLYGSFKAALSKFTKHAALEFAPYGIRVNTVAPGLTKVYDHPEGSQPRIREQSLEARIPWQRAASCEEIAKPVLFLCSDAASYITGANLLVDGGQALPAIVDNLYTERVAPIMK